MTKEIRPEWYKNLQTGPHRKKTFTAENITQIERKVSRSKKQDKRKRWLPITALSATAVVLLLGITLNLDRFTGTTGPSPDDGNAGPGITDPGEPPVGTNDPTEPPPDDQTPGPDIAPLGEETLVELASLDQVMLSEALPFSLDEVNEVSVRTADNEEITIVEEGPNNLVTFLGQVSLSQSTVDEEQSADQPQLDTMLRFETGDALYAIPYGSQANILDLGAGLVYADSITARQLHATLYPDSAIGQFVTAHNAVIGNTETEVEDRSQSYEADRLAIDGKTYYQWYEELVESPAEVQLPYYTQTGRFDAVRSHDEGGIVSWDLLVAFTTDAYQTSDGVRVGMSKDEVLEALGTPHIQTSIHWRYDIDNWDDLHLYFEGDTVRYVVLTTAD